MAVFHIILRHLALIGLPLFCEEIDREAFLKECSALVFLVLKDTYGGSAVKSRGYAGLFCSEFYMPETSQYSDTGSRLMCAHQTG